MGTMATAPWQSWDPPTEGIPLGEVQENNLWNMDVLNPALQLPLQGTTGLSDDSDASWGL